MQPKNALAGKKLSVRDNEFLIIMSTINILMSFMAFVKLFPVKHPFEFPVPQND